jgi:ornithine cyclodeaminase/alanine dehydrogenase-like protein (mu-crystallin family)
LGTPGIPGVILSADFLFLSQEDVVAAGGLEMGPTIEVVREALRLHAVGDTRLPFKPMIRWGDGLDSEEREGRIMAMPAYVGGAMDVAGLKWIPSVPDNPARGLPRGIGLIVLTARETGLPLAVMDGTVVSAMRTGAVTAVACTLLAPPGAAAAALLGAGVQARTQLMALREVLSSLREVRVWDVAEGRAAEFCRREAHQGGPEMIPMGDPEPACRGADVIVPVTMAPVPYVPPDWVGPGTLFVSISSLDPTVELIGRSDVLVCDAWEHESGHASRPFARALAAGAVRREQVLELGELVAGRRQGRTSAEQRVFVSPIGLAIEDVAAAHRVYLRARDHGLGTPLALWREPVWR